MSKRKLKLSSAVAAMALALAPDLSFGEEATAGRNEAPQKAAVKTNAAEKKAMRSPAAPAAPAEKKSYYVPTRGYRLEPQPDIPPYVRNLAKTYKEFEGVDWLNVGLDSRVRFEYRKDDYRPWTSTTTNPPTSQRKYFPNSLWLSRTRAYLGVQNILDPFRFAVEFQDSRAFNSIYEYQGQEINQTDLISAYGELYFKNAFGQDDLGNDRPLTLRAGRFHLELLDRRLIAENEFRNTTNNFDGFRVKIGKKENDWDIDSFLMRPVIRYPYQFDRPDWQNWIYGSVFSIRCWSDYATIQPYFLGRKQFADPFNVSNALKVHRDTYAPGLRVYGVIDNFDYDFDLNKQFGETGEFRQLGNIQNAVQTTVQHDAIAYAFEAGYTFSDHPWKPRISANYAYGSGNKSPYDSVNQTFDVFYGFNQPFSRDDYIAWNNVKAPKARIEFTPFKNLQVDTAFSAYWLASAAAAWDRVNLYAPLGNRGTFLGTEYDLRIRYRLNQFINMTASYAHFWPGSFTSSFAQAVALQPFFPQSFPGQTTTTNGLTARPTDFFYLEVSANAFGDGNPITKPPGADFLALVSSEGPPPPPAAPPSWRDVYVGLNGGGAWSSPRSIVQPWPFGAAVASPDIAVSATPIDQSNHLAGFVGGFQSGANWKLADSVLAGVEADLHAVSGNTDTRWRASATSAGGNSFATYAQRTATLNYLGTIRGRLGYLITPTLAVYGTGGMAYGGVISNAAILTRRIGGTNQTQVNPAYQDSLIGWTAGGGAEWMFTPEWSVKVDYLWYDLGAAQASSFAVQPNGFYATGASSSTRFNGNLIHAGVNRHFDLSSLVTAK
ncbi:MAG: alginate export family protein [Methylocystis sp.]|uniref:alginate export family protein n=1 Tax=Methylocystis sp. TaxID=1911079 RepID=UPI0039409595